MAVAGLQNLSILDSSFHSESQSSISGRWGNHDRPSARAPHLLQMWRELEGEHVLTQSQMNVSGRPRQQGVDGSNDDLPNSYLSDRQYSENGDSFADGNESVNECRTWSEGQIGLQNENEDGNSCVSEHSSDLGEVERGRVRQIFQEWMNSGIRGHASDASNMNSYSRTQCLGENECERVRIVREWVQMNSQRRGTGGGSREEQAAAEIGAQIEQVREGSAVNHREIGIRRNIRRLCGRQALLDLLERAERERQKELQDLLEHRPVSDFAHRNRIQSLLRGRFLRSGRLVQEERPSSVASSELGLLRQKHTVSDLREGFLSRLDNSVNGPPSSSHSDTSSNNDVHDFVSEQTQTNSLQVDLNAIQQLSPLSNCETDLSDSHTLPLEVDVSQDVNLHQTTAQGEHHLEITENGERESLSSSSTAIERPDGTTGNVDENQGENISIAWSQETSGNEDDCEEDVHVLFNHTDGYESNTIAEVHQSHTSALVEELQYSVDNEGDWQHPNNIEFGGSRDDNSEGADVNLSETTAHHQHNESLESEGEEHQNQPQLDEEWHENGLQDPVGMEGPSAWQATSVSRRLDSFYFQEDDDNVYSSDIRELLSRRSVSNLLQSNFRESLDRLIQSYVERQSHAPANWELDETSPSPSSSSFVEQDVQQSGGQNQGGSDNAERAQVLRSPSVTHSLPFWDPDLQDDSWPRNNLHRHLGIQEWEIINDLRVDMARLQQRMNNMQKMLEACMDMQLELQRALRQEVSAALNRSAGSTDGDKCTQEDEINWDHVRNGICCICSDNSIDSLLYRCGHMCTCSTCADKLVEGKGKCPMCCAPVIERIRAYFTQ
ncbi:hypothetical protein NMG60_11033280 [Bertholletia excelsa]